MSYEDSFEREAADERAYVQFESWYIFENLRPNHIGEWEWLLMFDRMRSYSTFAEAACDARAMAHELTKSVNIENPYSGCFMIRPVDYYQLPEGSHWPTYASKRADYIRSLVVENRYPDIPKIASDRDDRDRHGIFRHYFDEVRDLHQRWLMCG